MPDAEAGAEHDDMALFRDELHIHPVDRSKALAVLDGAEQPGTRLVAVSACTRSAEALLTQPALAPVVYRAGRSDLQRGKLDPDVWSVLAPTILVARYRWWNARTGGHGCLPASWSDRRGLLRWWSGSAA